MSEQVKVFIPEFHALRGWAWWQKRTKLLNGTAEGFYSQNGQDYRLVAATGIPPETVMAAIDEHQRLCRDGGLLKNDKKRRLSKVLVGGQGLIVKEYRHLSRWGVFSPDQRSWLGANRLGGACPCLAWLRFQGNNAYLLFPQVGEEDLFFQDQSQYRPFARELFRGVAGILARLHSARIYHADCKSSNFVCHRQDDGNFRLSLIDCDDVRCPCRLSPHMRAKNLAQFLGLESKIRDLETRRNLTLGFLRDYAELSGLGLPAVIAMIHDIQKLAYQLYPEQTEILRQILAPCSLSDVMICNFQ
jgi:hypothetical protein